MKVTLGNAAVPTMLPLNRVPNGSVAYDASGHIWLVVQGYASCLTRHEISGNALNSSHLVILYPKGTVLTIEVD